MSLQTYRFHNSDELNWTWTLTDAGAIRFMLTRYIFGDLATPEKRDYEVVRLANRVARVAKANPDPELDAWEWLHDCRPPVVAFTVCCPLPDCHTLLAPERLGGVCEPCFEGMRAEAVQVVAGLAA